MGLKELIQGLKGRVSEALKEKPYWVYIRNLGLIIFIIVIILRVIFPFALLIFIPLGIITSLLFPMMKYVLASSGPDDWNGFFNSIIICYIIILIISMIVGYIIDSRNSSIKRIILSVLFFLIIVSSISLGFVDKNYLNSAENPVSVKICDEIYWHKDKCYFNIAIKDGDIIICDKIKEEYLKGSCIEEIAINKENLTICKKLGWTYGDRCYLMIAIKRLNLPICNESQNDYLKDTCFRKIDENDDLLKCQKINDKDSKENCYEKIINDRINSSNRA